MSAVSAPDHPRADPPGSPWATVAARRARSWLTEMSFDRALLLLAAVAAVVALCAGFAFVEVAESVLRGARATTVDARVNTWMGDHRTDGATQVMRLVTRLADPVIVVAVTAGVAAVMVRRGRPRLAVFMITATALTGLFVAIVKLVVGRPRPATADQLVSVTGASFPSGHAAQSVACYLAIAVIVVWTTSSRRVGVVVTVLAVLVAVTVGGSRVYLGVHWTSDVVAGWALALSCVTALTAAWVGVVALRRRPGARAAPRGPEPEV